MSSLHGLSCCHAIKFATWCKIVASRYWSNSSLEIEKRKRKKKRMNQLILDKWWRLLMYYNLRSSVIIHSRFTNVNYIDWMQAGHNETQCDKFEFCWCKCFSKSYRAVPRETIYKQLHFITSSYTWTPTQSILQSKRRYWTATNGPKKIKKKKATRCHDWFRCSR